MWPKPKRRYQVNESFFSLIDTEPKAYWLGFLYADGCVVETGAKPVPRVLQVKLAGKDIEHLRRFAQDLGFGGPVRTTKRAPRQLPNGRVIPSVTDSQIAVGSVALCRDLIRLGCTPRKSLTLRFPTSDQVPPHLLHHFIRGYFDGDGCISGSAPPSGRRRRYNVQILGTRDVLGGIQRYLRDRCGFGSTKLYRKPGGSIFQLTYGGNNQARLIFETLYRGATTYLSRKWSKFQDCIQQPGGYRGLPPCEVVDPQGRHVLVEDYCSFARQRGLRPEQLWKVLTAYGGKERQTHRGYRLAGQPVKPICASTRH